MNEFDKTNEQDVTKGSKRRSFLKKSATGAVVFSLPAKSVWGACSVSGAMSGNLSTHGDRHDCLLPAFPSGLGGAGSSKWIDLNANTNTDANANDLFAHLETKFNDPAYLTYTALKAKYVEKVDELKAMPLNLPPEFVNPPLTCEELLASTESNDQKLGAAFLNASFGLYLDYSDNSMAVDELVTNIFLYIYTNEALGNTVLLSDSDVGIDVNNHAQNTTLILSV